MYKKTAEVSLFCKIITNFVAVILKWHAYEPDNLNEYGTEFLALNATHNEQQAVARRPPVRRSEGRKGCKRHR